MTTREWVAETSSFRDPNGFVFYRDGTVYRQLNTRHEANYNHLIQSGLYDFLVDSQLLVPHKEVEAPAARDEDCFKIIEPQRIPFVSYPYEWCFSQLKDAALIILTIQKKALEFGMSLRDCSAYNMQFMQARPVLIDTLSLGVYEEGKPWGAYKQFCQHFLAPLMLMSHRDLCLNRLCMTELDGIPLKLAKKLLSHHAYTSWSAFLHIYLHARYEEHYSERFVQTNTHRGRFSKHSFRGLIDSLENSVAKLQVKRRKSEWLTYSAGGHNYSNEALEHKIKIVKTYLQECNPKELWDLGANTGMFSRIANESGARVIAFDQDPHCVEANYLETKEARLDILPLVLNLSNPTPAIGWENQERRSLLQRASADTVLVLALIHHLAIANNVPLSKLASFFAKIGRWLIIEFVPKGDSMVQLLLANREDIFPNYTIEAFRREFSRFFSIESCTELPSSKRNLFLMRRLPEL
ncbi:MAG: SAM-dependent methyltransferase [Candidatus Binatia bacterium]